MFSNNNSRQCICKVHLALGSLAGGLILLAKSMLCRYGTSYDILDQSNDAWKCIYSTMVSVVEFDSVSGKIQ